MTGREQDAVSLATIEAAREVIASTIHTTPTMGSSRLGAQIGARLIHKAELFQKTGSFKARGALNRVHNTSPQDLDRGLIAVSGGNHAQGIAFAAARAGAPCLVVMPESVAPEKAAATREYGAEVLLHGDVNQAFDKMEELRAERGLTLVHPYDDPFVAAGQGTIGLEILEQVPEVTLLVVPVGGGGLISGIATAVKEMRSDAIRVVGVEHDEAAAMRASWDAGRPVRLSTVDPLVLSLAAPLVSDLTYEISRRYVDEIVTVTRQELREGHRAVTTSAKLYAEPAGAAPTSALLAGKIRVDPSDVVVAVVSGGNVGRSELEALYGGAGAN